MIYTLMPSLKHIAIVKIVTTLWNQDIRVILTKFYLPIDNEREEKWQEIENEVIKKVPQLLLPTSLKDEILGFIKPIGFQVLKWIEYHFENGAICLHGNIPIELCWTSHGTVNKKKTVQTLIKDDNLDIVRRYELACIYCLADDIPELWNKLSEESKKNFYSVEDPRLVYMNKLIALWTYDIKGKVSRMNKMSERSWLYSCSPNQYAFKYAAIGGNEVATRYFLKKLTPAEKEESLVNITAIVASKRSECGGYRADFPKEYYSDVLYFLLLQLTEEQQIEVLKDSSHKILKCFLDWPWQELFMKLTKHMWYFLSEGDCGYVLGEMVDKGYVTYDYETLFEQFWQQCPHTHKKYVINQCGGESLLTKLIKVEDKKNISLILKEATVAEKEKIIFHHVKTLCEYLADSNKWNLLKYFISECISSREVMIKFKYIVQNRVTCCWRQILTRVSISDKFLEMLDDFIETYDKKKSTEEDDSSSTKRSHSTEFEEATHL